MTHDTLFRLEAEIAAAAPAQEALLFAETARALSQAGDSKLQHWLAQRAYAQAALRLHRLALPQNGFQFGYLPPGTAQRDAVASSWRRGDRSALPFSAATPGLALLRAIASTCARNAERDLQAACGICDGLGWFVTADNAKRICAHRE